MEVRGQLVGSVLSFYLVGHGDQTQVISLDRKCALNHGTLWLAPVVTDFFPLRAPTPHHDCQILSM